MKKVSHFSIFGFAILLISHPVLAGPITLGFGPNSQNATLGTAANVVVNISGLGAFTAPSLGTYDLVVNYDPAILSYNSVAFGDPILGDQLDLFGLGSITSITQGAGLFIFELSLDSADDLNLLQAPAFTLFTLTFDSIGLGTSSLGLVINALGDADGAALDASVESGSITVSDSTTAVPEPSTFFLLGSGMLGIICLARTRFS